MQQLLIWLAVGLAGGRAIRVGTRSRIRYGISGNVTTRRLAIFSRLIAVGLLSVLAVSARAVEIDRYDELGDTALYATPGARQVVILLAGASEMPSLASDYAARLQAMGYAVAVVNVDTLFSSVAERHATCFNPVTMLDVYGQHLQEHFRFAEFRRPLLVGIGKGGPFAYLLMHQAPRNTYLGVISRDVCPELQLPATPCGPPVAWNPTGESRVELLPVHPPVPWVLIGPASSRCAGAGALGTGVAARAFDEGPDALRSAVEGVESLAASQNPSSTDDLPLIELPVAQPASNYFTIIVSGDGGWANIDKDIGEELNRRGIPVVGWNSLKYFWNRKTPEQAAADLGRVIARYGALWGRPQVQVVGFSLGADVLPFMLSRLPPSQRAAIVGVALLSPSRSVDFEFHLTNWLGSDPAAEDRPLAPELERLGDLRIRCFYGDDDEDSICPELPSARFGIVRKPGDHHFDGDYVAIADELLRGP